MTRRTRKAWLITGVSLAVVVVLVAVAAIQIVQSDWFRNYVMQKIIAATEDATGGKVEIGSFSFDWRHMRAVITDFVIHGKEPAGAAPFIRAPRVEADLRLFTSIHHILDVSYLGIDHPEANVFILADGSSNVPQPKASSDTSQPPLESIVDAAIGHFDLNDATIAFEDAKETLSLHANNFRAELFFNVLQQSYKGQIAFQPLYVASGRNTPVRFTVTLPLSIQKDKVALDGASIATDQSSLKINGSIENLRNPKVTARVLGQIALTDLKDLVDFPLTQGRGVPAALDLDAEGSASGDSIQVSRLQLNLGQSSVDASGSLKDSRGNGSLQFKAQLALGEIGRLVQSGQHPEGSLALNGTAKLDANDNYDVNADVTAKNVSATAGSRRVGNVDLTSALHADPHNINLTKLHLDALGGTLDGDASLQDFARYQFKGNLQHFGIQTLAKIAGEDQLPYSGTLQGPVEARGDLKNPNSLSADIKLSIAPGRSGVPVSGRLFANYNAAADDVRVDDSYIVLPHSRMNVAGSASRQLDVSLNTTDLCDLLAAASPCTKSPVDFQGHPASFTGTVTGGLSAAHVAGHLRAASFSVQGRMFDSLALDAAASADGLTVQQGSVMHGTMQALFSGQLGMHQWKVTPRDAIAVNSTIQNSDLADIFALAGQPITGTSGAFNATAQIGGTVGDPTGTAMLTATNGSVQSEPFSRIQAQVNLSDQLIAIPSATAERGNSRITLTAELHHARDSLTKGQIHAHVQSNQIELAQVETLQKLRPGTAGFLQVNVDATSNINGSNFSAVNGTADIAARALQFDGQNYGDLSATARAAGQNVQYQLTSTFAGSNIRATGNTQLQPDYMTALDATISNLPIERVLAAAKRTDIPASGKLSATVHFSGTKDSPTGDVDLNLTNAVLYDEPVQSLQAKASYQPQRAAIQQLNITAAGSQIGLTAEFDHPKDNLTSGTVQFHVNNTQVDLARVHNVQMRRPGLGGIVQVAADGAAELHPSGPPISVQSLKANLAAKGITTAGKNLGDATLTADSQNNGVNFNLTSNLAGASIQGRGTARISGDYPVDAQLTFNKVEWANLQPLLGSQDPSQASFNAGTDGQVTIQGPITKPEQLKGSIRLSRLELSSIAGNKPSAAQVSIKNAEPIAFTLDSGTLRIDSAHLTGSQTDLQAKGSLSTKDRTMNLTLSANADLGVLQTLDKDFSSSGNLTMATTVRGTFAKPAVNGNIQLKNASVNYIQFTNGISNANGTVQFNGNTATLANMTAETGGGKLTFSGFLLLSENPRFGLRTNASGVRIEVQPGVSVVANGNVNLTGTKQASTLSGNATITRVNYAPKTDLGAILTRAAPSVQTESTPNPLLDNMKLDVQVRTSDALAVQSSLAQSLEGNANIRVRGTASQPSVLGRVNMTGGNLAFFGNTYAVNSGSIAFYNPVRIEPIMDVSLETNTEGVDVTLRVTGPIDNLKLTYTSDPPLQFEEIVGLLATGKTPTSDPTLLANNPPLDQGVTQMGESAVLSQAIANPVAGRLQRVFGVSQLKINPEFTNGSSTPQTTLTLQQQITSNITFTYITQVDNANAETIRVEVILDPQWSAAAMRDQNGIFSINLLYKRQFR